MHENERAARTEEVWSRFSAQLKVFLRSRLDDPSSAEDVLQEVFVKVHAKIHTLRDDERIQSWLYQIARNAIADHFRAAESSMTIEEIAAAGNVAAAEPSGAAEQRLAASLLEMIHDLPQHYRDAIAMTEIEGLSQAEMAQRLHISLAAGKSRVQRGREKLKGLLLDCCHVEFDRLGNVIDYRKRRCCETYVPRDTGKPR